LSSAPIPIDRGMEAPIWSVADSITDFRQREPSEGAPASERTVVKVVRDAEALYVRVRAFADPRHVRSSQLRRDADFSSDDNVTILVDSFHDRRTAFEFRTNPLGAMWDAQLSNLDAENVDWNGIWDVAVTRDEGGWTALFRIPFRTLRFRAGSGTTFGFNVRRYIRARNEEDLWRSFGRKQGLRQLQNAGELSGFGGLDRKRDADLRPYVLGRAIEGSHDSAGTEIGPAGRDGKVGADAKLALSPTLTADLTLNTDFAQAEVDRQVINLTRFPTFFPEKREFFLESSGIFDFGTEQRVQLFYSRRIGLTDSGTTVPILGGARLHGRAGRWTLGVLDARTGGDDGANDAIVRVKHDLLERSYFGAIAMQRSGPGVASVQRAGGVDIDLPLVVRGHNVEPKAWLAATRVPDSSAAARLAWRLSTDYPNDLFDNFVSLYRIDAGFAPALGFVRRTGIWETTGHIDFMPRPHALGLRQLDLLIIPSWDIIANEQGSLSRIGDWETATFEWRPLGGTFQGGDRFEVNLQRLFDSPAESFPLFREVSVTPGRYWWTRAELQYELSPRRPLSGSALVSWGGFYDGSDRQEELSATWRGGGHLIVGGGVSRSDITLGSGRFTALQASGRLEYAFSTRSDLLGFVQIANENRRVDFNFRFHWIPVIGDDVFVVWNSGYTTDPGARYRFPSDRALVRPLNGALILKVVHRIAP
ncbi:MAG: carbohydrate binding family 9 domain-containing protein, partial [Gemmatimonadota bacterium]|nr:carbohydrate binding family 9 domain-containing protein [Gemmatimonadota bacterium]